MDFRLTHRQALSREDVFSIHEQNLIKLGFIVDVYRMADGSWEALVKDPTMSRSASAICEYRDEAVAAAHSACLTSIRRPKRSR